MNARFWSRVEFAEGCWLWHGMKIPEGYGQFVLDGGRTVGAHRFAYEFCVGPIPDGLTIDHLCRVSSCVNPSHLQPVTMRENTLRGIGPTAINARKTHCNHGHEFTEANTYYHKRSPGRTCRTCRRERMRRYNIEKVEAL